MRKSPTTKRVTKRVGKKSLSSPPPAKPKYAHAGAPTKYDPKYCKMLIQYAKTAEGSFRAFAAKLEVDPETLYEWAKQHPEFSKAKRVAKALNEKAMYDIGLKGMRGKTASGAWQTAWVFSMKARHGWREEGNDEPEDEQDVDFDFQ